jgi:hypothetical protein
MIWLRAQPPTLSIAVVACGDGADQSIRRTKCRVWLLPILLI